MMRTYYCFAYGELVPAEEISLPTVAEQGDIFSCFGLLYQVVSEMRVEGKKIYQLKFI
ncbi:hypothetical protein HNQ80_001776 [Anaerosolibacter carboniphilus]|uniref:Uncharacterized protein n=1 Tax=Anaerosolibacter carboniphilus TaxID=1417629 RepID=A0A841KQI3_9FIRM|nr:hypothetical protein [Anaerosolibacter carboniphilus]MBB6215687.1 hypothetical protein [Anaerosolibacter carboniphilus]